jgi:3-deoxy-D-manno-octulosonate 8-phosphate phosphatase (KDO 8-P phosphatase)
MPLTNFFEYCLLKMTIIFNDYSGVLRCIKFATLKKLKNPDIRLSAKLILMHILSRLKLIKTFIFDMDGVLTDGNLLLDHENNWLRKMNIRDGYALQLAARSGFNIIVISGSDSEEVKNRLQKLGITNVFMKITDKEKFLKEMIFRKELLLNETLYMGDDIPDYSCMKIAGIAACPKNAAAEIKEISAYISTFNGGEGCVRDVIEKVLKLNNKWVLTTNIPST